MTADTTTIVIALVFTIIGMFIGVYLAEGSKKCPHVKKCKLYQDNSATCNYTEGNYGDRIATCRVNFEEKKQ